MLLSKFGYYFTRKALLALNFIYVVIGVLLIFTSAYAKSASIVTSLSVLGGVIATGVILIMVAFLGFYGTKNHNQAALFFYMIILSCVFVVQFVVAVICLGDVSEVGLKEACSFHIQLIRFRLLNYLDFRVEIELMNTLCFQLIVSGWLRSDEAIKWDAQKAFGCCGLEIVNEQNTTCKKLPCHDECKPCLPVIVDVTSRNLSRVGLLGLLFSFSEIAGVWLAYRFRNIRDPEVDPYFLFL